MSPELIQAGEKTFREIWREWMTEALKRAGCTDRMARYLLDCGIRWSLPARFDSLNSQSNGNQ